MSEPQTEPTTRLIRASSDLLDSFGTRTEDGRRLTAEWGKPIGHCPDSDEYIYGPTFTATDDGYLAESRNATLDEVVRVVEGLPTWSTGFVLRAAVLDAVKGLRE